MRARFQEYVRAIFLTFPHDDIAQAPRDAFIAPNELPSATSNRGTIVDAATTSTLIVRKRIQRDPSLYSGKMSDLDR